MCYSIRFSRHYFVHIFNFVLLITVCQSQILRFRDSGGDTLNKDEGCHSAGFFGSTSDCTIFYRCVKRPSTDSTFDKYTFDCPPRLIYDKRISGCNRLDAVEPKPPCFQKESTNTTQAVHYPHHLLITGSKYGLVYFKYNTTETANYEDIESLELHQVLIDPFILTNFLALTTNLQKLILRDVQLTSDFEDQVSLPLLKEFHLSHINIIKIPSIGPIEFQANETTVVKDYRSYPAMFRTLIFFYKGKAWDWKIENIPQLETNIEVVLHGTQIFKMNWSEGQLRSQLLFTSDMIYNWDPPGSRIAPLVNLTLRNCPINVYSVPRELEVIDFEEVSYGNGTASDILRKNKNLYSVRMWFNPKSTYPKISLSDITKQIELLRIGQGHIVKFENDPMRPFPIGSYGPYVEFLHLDTLVFHKCQFSDEVVNEFSSLFKTRQVWIAFEQGNPQYDMLSSILKGNQKLELVGVKGFGRNPNPPPANYAEIEKFLRDAGVQEKQNDFVLEKRGGVWIGRFPTFLEQMF